MKLYERWCGDRYQIATRWNACQAQPTTIVGNVKHASQSISNAIQQLAAGNTDLSQRTDEQAASLEQTASSMEELTAKVVHNADNAQQATTLATTASNVAPRGGEVVKRVVETMRWFYALRSAMSREGRAGLHHGCSAGA